MTHAFPTRRSSDLVGHLHASHLADGALHQGNRLLVGVDRGHQEAVEAVLQRFAVVVEAIPDDLVAADLGVALERRSEEHTSELQSLMRISSAVFCLKQKKKRHQN